MKYCISCGVQVAPERLAIVPNTRHCSACIQGRGPARVKGVNIYLHKTAPSIQVMSAEYYESEWKKYTSSYGQGSGLHKVSPRMAGTA